MKILYFLLLVFLGSNLKSQNLTEIYSAQLPTEISETSGIIFYNGSFITINDSGNDAVLFFINRQGKILQKITVPNAKNVDWEDLAIDQNEILYIGNFGNNINKRRNLNIYKYNLKQSTEKIDLIPFSLSDQKEFPPPMTNRNFDLEAIIVLNDTLHLFSKNNTKPYNGYVKHYTLLNQNTEQIAQLKDSFQLGESGFYFNSVTSADFDLQRNRLILLCYQHIYVFWDFKNNSFFNGKYMKLNFGWLTQKESVVTVNDTLFITDEKQLSVGGKIRAYEYESYLNGKKEFKDVEMISLKIHRHKSGEYQIKGISGSSHKITIEFILKSDITKKSLIEIEVDSKGKFNKTLSIPIEINPDLYLTRVYTGQKLIYSNNLKSVLKK